jgi:hypothetical protein
LIDALAIEIAPRPRVAIQCARPPVEHTFARMRHQTVLRGEHSLEHGRGGSWRVIEIERLTETDDEFDALTGAEPLRSEAPQALARLHQIIRCAGHAETLEIRARPDQIGAVGAGEIASRLFRSIHRRFKLSLVVQHTRPCERVARVSRMGGQTGEHQAGGGDRNTEHAPRS